MMGGRSVVLLLTLMMLAGVASTAQAEEQSEDEILKAIQEELEKIEDQFQRLSDLVNSREETNVTDTSTTETIAPGTPETTSTTTTITTTTTTSTATPDTIPTSFSDIVPSTPDARTTNSDTTITATADSSAADSSSDSTTAASADFVTNQGNSGERHLLSYPSEGRSISDICTSNTKGDLCDRLTTTMNGISAVAGEVSQGEHGQDQLKSLQNHSNVLEIIIDEAGNDTDFLDSLNKIAFNDVIEAMSKDLSEAKEKIQDELEPTSTENHTLAIVLGTLGGLAAVLIISGIAYKIYNKKRSTSDHQATHSEGQTTSQQHNI